MDTISILAALDENYLPQLQVMITSLYMNNPERGCVCICFTAPFPNRSWLL